jgi:hypothetical protein
MERTLPRHQVSYTVRQLHKKHFLLQALLIAAILTLKAICPAVRYAASARTALYYSLPTDSVMLLLFKIGCH